MPDDPDDEGLRASMRRAVGGAFDATVGRVGHTMGEVAADVTGATAEQVIEEIEPYLVQEAVPRIVDGITPHLIEQVVPRVIDGVEAHLVGVTVPEVLRGMTPALVDELLPRILTELRPYLEQELVPQIVEGLMPTIESQVGPDVVDALMPKIRDEVAPQLVDALMPKIEAQVAPQLVDALMPKIRDEVAPELVDSLMPRIRDQVAPELVDSLMPRIQAEIAPQLVDALMPKIRNEVVPTILDDIVDDPRVRDLIREQSQGLFLDALESLRENLADADELVERLARRVLRRPPRAEPESAIDVVLDATGGGQAVALRRTLDEFAAQRRSWQSMPVPPAPPGREFAFAGAVTRLLGLGIDLGIAGWLISQGLSALVSLLGTVLDPIPPWLTVLLTAIGGSLVPMYLAVCWWLVGRTLGSWLVGTRVCTPDGLNPGFVRSLVRAWVGLGGLVIWVVTAVVAAVDDKRRSALDRLMRTEVRYVVPDNQQHRYIREAVQARRDAQRVAAGTTAPPDPAGP